MAGPAHPLRLVLLAALLSSATRAQTSAPLTGTSAAPEPPVSAKLARLFAGTPPKFDPPKAGASASAAVGPASGQPRNGIIRLPTYVVRGSARSPDEYEILTPKGQDAAMAQRYLGPQSGLDRALNAVTLTDLWKSVPLLGRIPFVPFNSLTYDQRAATEYERIELRRRFGELLEIEEIAHKTEQTKPAAPPTK